MIKKIIALAAGVLLSSAASAGYVRYDFSGPLTGYFIQHDTDQSIADYRFDLPIDVGWSMFRMGMSPQASEGVNRITEETTYFRNNGPTNFRIFSNFGGDQTTGFSVLFSRGTQGNFEYTAQYASSIYFCGSNGCGFSEVFTGTHVGLASEGVMHPGHALGLDYEGGYSYGVPHIVPTYIGPNNVPEPGSLALLAAGVIGLASLRRRRMTT